MKHSKNKDLKWSEYDFSKVPFDDLVRVGHREVYFDIECEVTDGFPDPQRAENKITAIALYDKTMDSYHCFVLGDVPNTDVVESFQSEEELLQRFYQKYKHPK